MICRKRTGVPRLPASRPSDRGDGSRPRQRQRGKRGTRAPQLKYVPAYTQTSGKEAIKLAAGAGLVLDGWAQDFLTDSPAEDEYGNCTCFECGLIVSRQNGK